MVAATRRLTLALNLLGIENILPGGMEAYVAAAARAEAAGIDGIVMPDHVVMGEDLSDYPFDRWEAPPEMYWPEPLVVLAAIAGATKRLQLATSILVAPLRPAVLVAKQAATLDSISGGRFELGAGFGWQRAEYLACGVDFLRRRQILEDQLDAFGTLWRGELTSFASPTVNFPRVCCQPRPFEGRRIPVWLGIAATPANTALMARHDAGWAALRPVPEFIAQGTSALRAARRDAGLTPTPRVRTSPRLAYRQSGGLDWESIERGMAELVQAGVTHFDFPVSFMSSDETSFDSLLEHVTDMAGRLPE